MSSPAIRPKGLSKIELATLGIWFVAIGRWDHMDFSEPEAQEYVLHFFRCLKDPENGLKASYLSLQNTLMAMRRGSFEAIQSEPPFSRYGRRNMKLFLKAWLEGGEAGFTNAWGEIFGAGGRSFQPPLEQPIRILSRSGNSPENAIQVLTDYREDRINAEYWHLYYEYGQGWRREMQMSTAPDASGRRYDVLTICFDSGEKQTLYFLLS
jgi:hypothetical protein